LLQGCEGMLPAAHKKPWLSKAGAFLFQLNAREGG